MSTTGLPVFDRTVQETNLWLEALQEKLHFEQRHHAYSALRAVLHALRDRLTPASAVHLGAQLPMLVRGFYYEGWRIAGKPTSERTVDEFCGRIGAEFPPQFPVDALNVAKAVFEVLWEQLDPGETSKVIDQLPSPLRTLWPEIARPG